MINSLIGEIEQNNYDKETLLEIKADVLELLRIVNNELKVNKK